MGPATPPLVVWFPTENEVLSPLEGQLDMVADGLRNVPAKASTLWELLQYWCLLLRRRVGVTEQEVLREVAAVLGWVCLHLRCQSLLYTNCASNLRLNTSCDHVQKDLVPLVSIHQICNPCKHTHT